MKYFSATIGFFRKVLFGYATPRCVGVDIGSAAIKMLALQPDSLKVARYSIKPLAKNMVRDGVINQIEQVSELVKDQWDLLQAAYNQVAIAIPYNSVIIKDLTAPLFKNTYQLDDYVKQQLIYELGIEDIDFDYTLVKNLDNQQQLSVVVAKKEKIEEYQAILQMTGIAVAAIDVESFAIQNLLSLLLQIQQLNQQIIFIDIGLTKIRAYVFDQQQAIYFNEISVNYLLLIEDAVTRYGEIKVSETVNANDLLIDLIQKQGIVSQELIDVIVSDVSKLLQLVKSNILVEKKITLIQEIKLYLMGGNALIPGVVDKLNNSFEVAGFVDELTLAKENPNIPRHDLMRLITAIALATWGQKIDTHQFI